MTPILVVIVCTFIIFTNGQQFNFLQRNLIGSQCQRPSDCGDGMGCGSGRCQCLVSYIQVDRRCLRKLDPGDSPCQVDAQCQAAWPTSRCQNTICQCTRGAKVRTRDGIVCVEHAKCPVGGADAVLKETSGTPVTCSRDGNGRVSGCNNQLHMYDCIADKFNGKGYCCPNKGKSLINCIVKVQ